MPFRWWFPGRTRGLLAVALTAFIMAVALAGGAGPFLPTGFAAASQADYGPNQEGLFSPLMLPETASPSPVSLVLNVAACRLYVYRDGVVEYIFPTAVGRMTAPTPTGHFSIISKRINPTWYPLGGPPVPPGPANPLGTRWMGFTWRGHGLHGNNAPWIIGQPGSAGCVRLHNEDAETLFELVRIGTPLRVLYEPVELGVSNLFVDQENRDNGDGDEEIGTGSPGDGFVLSLFPDIYHRLDDYQDYLISRMALAGRELDPAMAAWLTEAVEVHRAVTWDTASRVYYRGHLIQTDIIRLGRQPENPPLIDAVAFGQALGLSVGRSEESGALLLSDRVVENAVALAGRYYAGLDDLARAAGGSFEWAWEVHPPVPGGLPHRSLLITARHPVYVNRYALPERALYDSDETYVPIRAVATVLGLPLIWDPDLHAVIFLGRELPVRIIGETGFVRAQNLAEALAGFLTLSVDIDGVYIFR